MDVKFDDAGNVLPCHAAEDNVTAQARLLDWQQDDWYGINLSLAWRETGRQAGVEPERWAKIATPLLCGFAEYAQVIGQGRTLSQDPGDIEALSGGVLRRWGGVAGSGPDDWAPDDVITEFPAVALAYASYLDHHADEDHDASQRGVSPN